MAPSVVEHRSVESVAALRFDPSEQNICKQLTIKTVVDSSERLYNILLLRFFCSLQCGRLIRAS